MKKVVLVDDMPSARRILEIILNTYSNLEIVGSFGNSVEALKFILNNPVDLVFLDIEMPGMSGLEVAEQLEASPNKPLYAFATAFNEYSLDAWKTSAIGYITKPYDREEVDKLIKKFYSMSPVDQTIDVTCFPNFGVSIGGSHVVFKNEKAQEILAYLVYSRGEWVRTSELSATILEDLDAEKAKDSFRSYMSRLKRILDSYNIGDLVEQKYGQCRVKSSMINCDYYRYLNGETHLFMGEFLKSYNWAEPTLAVMELMNNKQK